MESKTDALQCERKLIALLLSAPPTVFSAHCLQLLCLSCSGSNMVVMLPPQGLALAVPTAWTSLPQIFPVLIVSPLVDLSSNGSFSRGIP